MMASSGHWLGLFGIGIGVLVTLAVILSQFRAKTIGIIVLLMMMMAFAAVAMFLVMPAGRIAPGARLVPPIPPVPKVELPLASLDADRFNLDLSVENIKEHGDRAVEIARIKIQAGAEAMSEVAQQVADQTRVLMREHNIPPIPNVADRVVDGVRHAQPAGLAASGLMAFAIGALLYLGYILLDAGTRGHFTWSLRIVSVVTFAALCLALSILRHGL